MGRQQKRAQRRQNHGYRFVGFRQPPGAQSHPQHNQHRAEVAQDGGRGGVSRPNGRIVGILAQSDAQNAEHQYVGPVPPGNKHAQQVLPPLQAGDQQQHQHPRQKDAQRDDKVHAPAALIE